MQPQKSNANAVRAGAVKSGFVAPEPMVDQNPRRSGVGRLLALGIVLIGAGVVFVLLRDRIGDQYQLTALGIFAMIGIFYLFASVIGFIQIAPRTASDALSKAFLDSQPQGVVITDKRDRVIYANRAYAEITGAATAADIRSVGALFGNDADASGVIYRMSQLSGEGGASEQEIRSERALSARGGAAGGTPAWYRLRARALSTETMLKKFFVWQIADITGERLNQERYFVQVQEAINHLDLAPTGFIATDALHNVTYINASLAHWLGIDLADFVPGRMNLNDLIAGDGMALVRAAHARGAARNAVFDLDLLKMNGSALPVRFLFAVHRGADGQVAGTRVIVLNRAEGDESTDDVRNAEVRFTRFFNSTPMAIAAIEKSGGILRTNAPFVSLFGDPRAADGAQRALDSFVHLRDRPALQRAIAAAADGQADIAAIDTVFATDEDRHLRIFVNAVVGGGQDAGHEEAAIIHVLETTEQKALEAQMAQGQKMQAVGQLAGGIAHDFNNVLSAIILSSDLLLTNQRPSDPSFADIMSIKQNANRAASLVRQLLAFSRRQTLRPETLDLTDVLADIRMLLSRLVGTSVDLKIEHGRDIWPVRADLGQLEQVLTNLCINARDAMPGGGAITVSTRNVPTADIKAFGRKEMPEIDHVMVSVRDTGTGIDPANIKKIFEPFFTTKDVGKGTGLGLSMVYGIIKQSGGFIYVDSELGKGTEFQILLPRLAVVESEAKAAAGDATRTADAGPAKPAPATSEGMDLSGQGVVLLVEDEDAVRMGGVRALRSRGYTVIEATTGVEALEAFREADGGIDLIVSDVVMPEMDGPTLLGEVRKLQPDIKFIFVSGYAEDAFAKNLPPDAVFGFLPKPFSLKQLATTVKEWMEKPA